MTDRISRCCMPDYVSGECRHPADVVIAMDATGSVHSSNFRLVKEFSMELIRSLNIDNGFVNLGLFKYGDSPETVYQLGELSNTQDAVEAVSDMEYMRGDNTRTDDALSLLYNDMFLDPYDDPIKQNIVILITHGGSQDPEATFREAMAAKMNGIHLIVIAAGSWVDESEVQAVASHPYQRNLIRPESYRDMINYVDEVKNMICNSKSYYIIIIIILLLLLSH